ncbi:cellulose synthase/poly-beta-1,6-N-acetylglucosamine synthase-like glycosyltransferase [Murinocardiopsis flavida]|uniref:Cellulose synthase/poly-beta-1,6-N-acetylglucosamine synthase-like glycosyltransferase n=1 Tax=Murinocardiopsis flavida TaxID=645275 RepID=A0A2P8DQM0_9ACTN|nr:glycosyltransferase family 2 protein [Murinocardiopsis flavida]PSK99474.1 cellulose synthase/poly-beta-1,6-N-acetylglucosamine synthase-like glycosyltransferase [Murinocardiopsis flavida]
MRTARFIGSWVAGLIALALAVTLFVQWIGFALGAGGSSGAPPALFLWMAFGVNLLVWSLVGLVRLGDDSIRALAGRGSGRTDPAAAAADADRVLVRAKHAAAPVGGSGGTGGGASGGTGPSGGGVDGIGADDDTGGAATTATIPLRRLTVSSGSSGREGGAAPGSAGPQALSLAVIIPAHNEAPVIDGAIASALRLFNRWDIYVVSDSSHDATADIAAETGVNVLELLANRGKAGALEAVIQEFDLTENYDGVVILDADTELDEGYVEGARRQLAEPGVAAVAGFVVAEWKPEERTLVGRLISAYRDRLYWMLQYLIRFGQTWRHTSVTFIVPGFASTYRTSVLKDIDINPKGLVIEDFNMTFEVHHRKLGRISMRPGTKAYCQDPFTLADYVSQVRRWTLGFWQTVRRHGVWPSLFWFVLFGYIMEVLLVAVLLLVTAALGVFTLLPVVTSGAVLEFGWYATGYDAVSAVLPLTVVAVGLFVPDYMLTCIMAMIRRRPSYLVYGLFFLPMRIVDSYLTLRTIPQAWTARSDGRWQSPDRATKSL